MGETERTNSNNLIYPRANVHNAALDFGALYRYLYRWVLVVDIAARWFRDVRRNGSLWIPKPSFYGLTETRH